MIEPSVSTSFSSRKKIDHLQVVGSLNVLIVLSGGDLSLHDLETLKPVVGGLALKKVSLFCVNQIGSGTVNRLCVAGKGFMLVYSRMPSHSLHALQCPSIIKTAHCEVCDLVTWTSCQDAQVLCVIILGHSGSFYTNCCRHCVFYYLTTEPHVLASPVKRKLHLYEYTDGGYVLFKELGIPDTPVSLVWYGHR